MVQKHPHATCQTSSGYHLHVTSSAAAGLPTQWFMSHSLRAQTPATGTSSATYGWIVLKACDSVLDNMLPKTLERLQGGLLYLALLAKNVVQAPGAAPTSIAASTFSRCTFNTAKASSSLFTAYIHHQNNRVQPLDSSLGITPRPCLLYYLHCNVPQQGSRCLLNNIMQQCPPIGTQRAGAIHCHVHCAGAWQRLIWFVKAQQT